MRRLLIAAVLALVTAGTPAAAQTVGGIDIRSLAMESSGAVEAVLSNFATLITEANAARMGFPDAGAVRQAEVGVPFADFVVDLPRLAAFRAGVDPASLLRPTEMIIYPLRIVRDGHSSITLARRGGTWLAVSLGSPSRTRALVTTRDAMARSEEGRLEEYFEVRVAALNLLFVGHITGVELRLTPTVDAPEHGLVRGRTLPAATVFAGLSEAAARDPGGLR